MAGKEIDGGCLCGAVRYRVTGEFLFFQYCHCSRCRKFTGSAHAANMFTRPDSLEWISGEKQRGTYTLEGSPQFPTAFCKTCGSALPSMSSTGNYWVIPAGSVEGDPGVQPSRSIFWESRAPWYQDVSALPRHAELPSK